MRKSLVLWMILVQSLMGAQMGNEYTLGWEDPTEMALGERKGFIEMFIRSFHQAYRACGSFADKSDEEVDAYLANYCTTFVEPHFAKSSSLFVVLRRDGEIIGGAFFEKSAKDEIYVAELVIDSQHWHKGLGRYLMEALLQKEPGTKKIWLITEWANKGAQGFYEALGFVTSPHMHEGYSPDLYCGYERIISSSPTPLL
jgi:ribosomal protein S18 acetylase RimI-like enzyme